MNNERDKMQARFLDREYVEAVVGTALPYTDGFREPRVPAAVGRVHFLGHWDAEITMTTPVLRFLVMCVPVLSTCDHRKLFIALNQQDDACPEDTRKIVLCNNEEKWSDEFHDLAWMLTMNGVIVLVDKGNYDIRGVN